MTTTETTHDEHARLVAARERLIEQGHRIDDERPVAVRFEPRDGEEVRRG